MKKAITTILIVSMLLNTSAPIVTSATVATTAATTTTETKVDTDKIIDELINSPILTDKEIAELNKKVDSFLTYVKNGNRYIVDNETFLKWNGVNNSTAPKAEIDAQVKNLKQTITIIQERNKNKNWNAGAIGNVVSNLKTVERNLTKNPSLQDSKVLRTTIVDVETNLNKYAASFVSSKDPKYVAKLNEKVKEAKNIVGNMKVDLDKVEKYEVIKNSRTGKSITVVYGNHFYGCDDQEQYNTVLKHFRDFLTDKKRNEDIKSYGSQSIMNGFRTYCKGKRPDQYKTQEQRNLQEYTDICAFVNRYGDLATNYSMTNKSDIEKVFKIVNMNYMFNDYYSTKRTEATTYSAYQTLFGGKGGDCDAYAYTQIAYRDMLGYNTAVLGNTNHSAAYMEIDDTWYSIESGLIRYATRAVLKRKDVFHEPTKGIETLTSGWDIDKIF